MGENSRIGWCQHTFNAWIGCEKVAPGCKNCYAAALQDRYRVTWGSAANGGTRRRTSDDYWKEPIKWNRKAELKGQRDVVFVDSLSDVFEDWPGGVLDHKGQLLTSSDPAILPPYEPWVPGNSNYGRYPLTVSALRRDLFKLIDSCPQLDWLLLTKRPENILSLWPCPMDTDGDGDCGLCASGKRHHFRPNVRIGCSISDQETADSNIPHLMRARPLCPTLFVSAEPLLAPVDLTPWLEQVPRCEICLQQLRKRSHSPPVYFPCPRHPDSNTPSPQPTGLDWVIVGGESGDNYREVAVDAIEAVAYQCQTFDVPVYVKQDSAHENEQQGRIFEMYWNMKQQPRVAK